MISHMLHDAGVLQALVAGTVVSVLCGCVGVLVVLRRQSFAGHAVTDIGFTGGAGAPIVGAESIVGLLAFSVSGALVMARLGDRVRERDVATGVVLTAALGVGALFLFIETRYVSEPAGLLFGSIFAVRSSVLTGTMWVGLACVAALALLYRPLVFSTVGRDAAAARGVPVAFIDAAFLVVTAIAVAEAAQLVGVLLTTAVLIGPASAATALCRRIPTAMAASILLGVAIMWLSIALAYASYGWPPGGKGWPVGFFVGLLTLAAYAGAQLVRRRGNPA